VIWKKKSVITSNGGGIGKKMQCWAILNRRLKTGAGFQSGSQWVRTFLAVLIGHKI